MNNTYKNYGITAKFISMLADVNASTISRAINDYQINMLEGTSKRNRKYGYRETRRLLKELISNKKPIAKDKNIISFYNFKGGTGKTSLCYQVSNHLAMCGYNVLVVDADAQSSLTVSFGIFDNLNLPTIYDGLVNNIDVRDLIINIDEGLDLIPSNLSLTKLEIHLKEHTRQENVLKRYLGVLAKEYDFIIFDSHPNITILNRNILNFSNIINVICETRPYSVHGMKLVMDDMFEFYDIIESPPPDILVVPNLYEDRAATSVEAMTLLIQGYQEYLAPNFAVRKSEDFPSSATKQLPLSFFCKSNSIAFEDVSDLVKLNLEKAVAKDTLV